MSGPLVFRVIVAAGALSGAVGAFFVLVVRRRSAGERLRPAVWLIAFGVAGIAIAEAMSLGLLVSQATDLPSWYLLLKTVLPGVVLALCAGQIVRYLPVRDDQSAGGKR